ncbi:cell division protein FtsQ/DivIB [Sinomonas terrae]|uniref:Cell division protein FtsQ/DivIB n=1 Tax=Sinomonas terrae TaxID=2908838 RepID=A0ABS9U1S7_9MICC|nr:FtsQ-type POTRA domain-containing protein [Sinomonas terrae]MCH6470629.1 cell division protein FtsQ/DivIB [Sinomonas terrae]
MAPSPRKPRVPRVGPSGPPQSREEDYEASFDQAPSDQLPPVRGGAGESSVGRSSGGRVSVGRSAKVTVLHPVDDGADEPDEDQPLRSNPAREQPTKAHRAPSKGSHSLSPARLLGRRTPDAGSAAGGSRDVLAFPVPRAKRIRRRVVLVAVALVAVVAAVMGLVLFTPVLAVHTITVEGTKMLAPAQVQEALAPLKGKPLPLVGPSDVSRLVAPIVQVKSVQSRAVPPNTLLVTVVERVPVALVKQTDGFSVVDGDGVQIATAKDQSAYPVPVIDPQGAHMSHDTFLAVTSVLSALPQDVLGQLATASAQSVDSVQLKLSNGQTVVWGNTQDRDLKAKVLEALMKSAQNPPQGQAPVNVFDVSTPWHPVTR